MYSSRYEGHQYTTVALMTTAHPEELSHSPKSFSLRKVTSSACTSTCTLPKETVANDLFCTLGTVCSTGDRGFLESPKRDRIGDFPLVSGCSGVSRRSISSRRCASPFSDLSGVTMLLRAEDSWRAWSSSRHHSTSVSAASSRIWIDSPFLDTHLSWLGAAISFTLKNALCSFLSFSPARFHPSSLGAASCGTSINSMESDSCALRDLLTLLSVEKSRKKSLIKGIICWTRVSSWLRRWLACVCCLSRIKEGRRLTSSSIGSAEGFSLYVGGRDCDPPGTVASL